MLVLQLGSGKYGPACELRAKAKGTRWFAAKLTPMSENISFVICVRRTDCALLSILFDPSNKEETG
jgi:hypothetical protein